MVTSADSMPASPLGYGMADTTIKSQTIMQDCFDFMGTTSICAKHGR